MTTLFLIALYFMPVIVAYAVKTPSKQYVWLVNGFLGWTVIGWFVALGMCVYLKRQTPGGAPALAPASTGPLPVTPPAPSSAPSSMPWQQAPEVDSSAKHGSGSTTPPPPQTGQGGAMPWDTPGTS
jgi:Superinfection immunity protein